MLGIYLLVAVLIAAVGLFVLGRKQAKWEQGGEQDIAPFEYIWTLGIGAVMWPFLFAVACIFGPFVGLFYLGWRTAKNK